jgi:hypothetical protein
MAQSQSQINVVFGAQVAQLIAGIQQATSALHGFQSTVAGISGPLTELSEAFAAAFAIKKLAEFVKEMAEFVNKMGEMAERTQVAAAAIGATPEEVSKLSVELELLTGKADLPTRAMESLATNITSGSKKAQAALKDLAISGQDVQKMMTDNDFALRRLSQAFNEGEAGWARTADFVALIGKRFYEQLIPALKQSAAQWAETSKAAEESGAILTGPMLSAFERVFESTNKLKTAWDALVKNTMYLFSTAAENIVTILTHVVNGITAAVQWLGTLGQKFNQVSVDIRNATNDVENFIRALVGAAPNEFKEALLPPKLDEKSGGGRHLAGPGTEKEAKGKKEPDDRMSEWRDALKQQLQDEQNFLSDSKKEELAYWQDKLQQVGTGTKEDLKLRREVNAEIFSLQKSLAKQTETDAIAEQTFAQKVNDQKLSTERAHLQTLENIGKLTAQQRITADKALLDEEIKADEDYYHKKEAAAQGDLREITKLEQEEYLQHQKLVDQKAALDDQALEASHKSWKAIADQITGAIDTSVMGVIQGTQTIGQAFAKLGQSILEMFAKLALDKMVHGIFDKLWDGLGLGVGAASGGGGGFLSFLGGLPLIGTLFGGGSGAGASGVIADSVFMERGGIIPSAAGGWQVPGNMMAMLHQNEMVLPSHISQGFHDMFSGRGGGGGSTVNLAVHAWDTMTGGQQLMRNAQSVGQAFAASGISPRALSAGGGRFP